LLAPVSPVTSTWAGLSRILETTCSRLDVLARLVPAGRKCQLMISLLSSALKHLRN
jgi:hypothetical protein